MPTEMKAGATARPWVVSSSASCDARIESASNTANWNLTGISCHPQYNGSGKAHGPSVLVSPEEAKANAALIVEAVNQHEALVALVSFAKHRSDCHLWSAFSDERTKCTCGLEEALANLDAARKATQ